jgi:hypothetical protein
VEAPFVKAFVVSDASKNLICREKSLIICREGKIEEAGPAAFNKSS